MKCYLFIEEDGSGALFTSEENVDHYKEYDLIDPDAKVAWTVERDTWEECMQAYYDYMDWGTYYPPGVNDENVNS